MKAFICAVFLLAFTAGLKAAPLMESTGDMTVMVFNPFPAPVEFLFNDAVVASAEGGVAFNLIPEMDEPFTPSVTGAGDDPFIYVDDAFPGLLFHWDNGVETSCTNCVLSPIPLPASGLLFVSAILGLAVVRRA